jgi:glycosyltransferase involved in cell wall biosynthesis
LNVQVLLTTCAAWYLRQTAEALQAHNALGALWITDNCRTPSVLPKFRRCWAFHLAMKPYYHWAPQLWREKAFYFFLPLWKSWIRRQLNNAKPSDFDVVHAIMGYGTEPFDYADRYGKLKVLDAQNSHPTSYYGYWQRECDIWCPGERVPIPQWMFARMNRELERADMALCPSTFVRDSMVMNGIPAEKCFVNPFGVDTSIFQARSSVPEKIRIVTVGTICVRKGHQYLFRAFEILKKKLPNAELICVGDYKADFRRERPRWEGTFTHYRSLRHQELAALLKTCSCFVMASLEEGFARVLSEAMAAGLPVVATYESGAATLIKDGDEGFIVPSRRPDKMAEALVTVCDNTELNKAMGERAHLAGAARNTWQDYGDRLLAKYEELLAQH